MLAAIPTTWRVLNGLRRPGGRLVFNAYGDRYDLYPHRQPVGKGVVAVLEDRGYVSRVAERPATVYGITEAGRAAWERAPESVTFSGTCDNCGATAAVRPKRVGLECLYLCAGCLAQLLEEDNGLEEASAPKRL